MIPTTAVCGYGQTGWRAAEAAICTGLGRLFFRFSLFLLFRTAVAGGTSPDFSAFGSSVAFSHKSVSFPIVLLNDRYTVQGNVIPCFYRFAK